MEDSLTGLFALLATWNPIVLVIIGLGAIFLFASDWKYLKAAIKRAYNHGEPDLNYYPGNPGEADIFIDGDVAYQYYAKTGWIVVNDVTEDLILVHEWPEVPDDPDEKFEFTLSHDEAENLHFCFDFLFQEALLNGLKEGNDSILWDDLTRAYRLTKEMQS